MRVRITSTVNRNETLPPLQPINMVKIAMPCQCPSLYIVTRARGFPVCRNDLLIGYDSVSIRFRPLSGTHHSHIKMRPRRYPRASSGISNRTCGGRYVVLQLQVSAHHRYLPAIERPATVNIQHAPSCSKKSGMRRFAIR